MTIRISPSWVIINVVSGLLLIAAVITNWSPFVYIGLGIIWFAIVTTPLGFRKRAQEFIKRTGRPAPVALSKLVDVGFLALLIAGQWWITVGFYISHIVISEYLYKKAGV